MSIVVLKLGVLFLVVFLAGHLAVRLLDRGVSK